MKLPGVAYAAILLALTSIVAYSAEDPPINEWPAVMPAEVKIFVTSEKPKVVLDVFSKDDPTKKLYQLRCNIGDSTDRARGEDEYYGMWQCHLIQVGSTGPELLEGEYLWNRGKSYNTRGKYTYEQLIGPCKTDPEFGLHREFNMRRMKLELSIKYFTSPPIGDMIKGTAQPSFDFDFEAKVVPNDAATSEYTWPSAKKYCGGYYEFNSDGILVYHEIGS